MTVTGLAGTIRKFGFGGGFFRSFTDDTIGVSDGEVTCEPTMAGLLTLEESAQRLKLPVDEVLRLVERRQLFPLRDGPILKFKPDEIDRYASSMQELDSLDLDGLDPVPSSGSPSREAGAPAPAIEGDGPIDIPLEDEGSGGGLPSGIVGGTGDVSDSAESIFADSHLGAVNGPGAKLRLDEVEGTAIFTSSPGGLSSRGGAVGPIDDSSPGAASGVSGAAIGGDDGDLELDGSLTGDSIVPLSAPGDDGLSLETGRESGSPAIGSDSGVSGLSIGGLAAKSGISDVASLSVAGESGISLDDGDLEASGILLSGVNVDEDVLSGVDLGDSRIVLGAPADGGDEDSVSLDAFDPVQVGADGEDSASGVFAASSGDGSSFFDASISPDASSFDGGLEGSAGLGGYEVVVVPAVGNAFGSLQVVGLVCCTLLLLTGGLVCLDLVGAIGSINGPRISAPLLDSLSELFGWK